MPQMVISASNITDLEQMVDEPAPPPPMPQQAPPPPQMRPVQQQREPMPEQMRAQLEAQLKRVEREEREETRQNGYGQPMQHMSMHMSSSVQHRSNGYHPVQMPMPPHGPPRQMVQQQPMPMQPQPGHAGFYQPPPPMMKQKMPMHQQVPVQAPAPVASPMPAPVARKFVDPAIVAMTRPSPSRTTTPAVAPPKAKQPPRELLVGPKHQDVPPLKIVPKHKPVPIPTAAPAPAPKPKATPMIEVKEEPIKPGLIPVSFLPASVLERRLSQAVSNVPAIQDHLREDVRKLTPAAVLVDPMEKMTLENGNNDADTADILAPIDAEAEILINAKANRGRRNRNRRRGNGRGGEETGIGAAQENLGEGWRKTPFLAPNKSFQPYESLNKKALRNRIMKEDGWATEDATDVQEAGDFDFIANNKAFDKVREFEKIRESDVTADEDRLVGHNRLPQNPKNFGNTEMVLDGLRSGRDSVSGKVESPAWNTEGSETDDEKEGVGSAHDTRAGRAHASGSNAGGRTSRRDSRRGESLLRTSIGPGGHRDSGRESVLKFRHESPQPREPGERRPRNAMPAGTPRSRSQAKAAQSAVTRVGNRSAFYTVPADDRVEPASALEMLNMENVASEMGLTEEMMTQDAGRGIAEIALKTLNSRHTHKPKEAYVVVYAGNNKSGARAISAGRILHHHGAEVVVVVLGPTEADSVGEAIRRQLDLFRNFGGKVYNKSSLFEILNQPKVSVELIIDGLLGMSMSFEELRLGEQAAAYELIEYANRSRAAVLAIDVPTGLSPISGAPMRVDGLELFINPEIVASLSVPKKGLLEAMRMGLGCGDGGSDGLRRLGEWKLYLVDVGIGKEVWREARRKGNMGMGKKGERKCVKFGGEWVVGVRFQKGSD